MTKDVDSLLHLDALGPALALATGDDRWHRLTAELITGGVSNLTFTLRSHAGELILRRPPSGTLLPSAHDMLREAQVQRALSTTDVPVPRIVLVDDGALLGRPCYVMEKVSGHVIRGALPADYADTPAQRRRLAFVFADTLARIHAVEPAAIGLGDYGRPDGFMTRQLRRWTAQWQASRARDIPEIDELSRRLASHTPPSERQGTIVHGDYRLDNVVYHPSDPGTITAVLDWELSTLGDPLTDLALLALFWPTATERQPRLVPGVAHLPGFPSRDEMLQRYAESSGADLADLAFYLAFACFKYAVIVQGVAARSEAGTMGGQDFGDLDDEVMHLATTGLTHLKHRPTSSL